MNEWLEFKHPGGGPVWIRRSSITVVHDILPAERSLHSENTKSPIVWIRCDMMPIVLLGTVEEIMQRINGAG